MDAIELRRQLIDIAKANEMKAFIEQATFEMVKCLSKGENKDDWRSMLASDVGIYSTLLRLKAL